MQDVTNPISLLSLYCMQDFIIYGLKKFTNSRKPSHGFISTAAVLEKMVLHNSTIISHGVVVITFTTKVMLQDLHYCGILSQVNVTTSGVT